jgi:hypothetical protein
MIVFRDASTDSGTRERWSLSLAIIAFDPAGKSLSTTKRDGMDHTGRRE